MSFSAMPVSDYDWDHEETAAAYEIFSARHDRYRVANRALVENAYVENSLHILDFAAGMGATTQALLSEIRPEARVVCVEPSYTMRSRGRNQVQDYRVSWQDGLPDADTFSTNDDYFDRIVCGAAIWQMLPLHTIIEQLSCLLKPGGALCFNIPALYLGEADQPGGGDDPNLWALPGLLQQRARELIPALAQATASPAQALDQLTTDAVDKMLHRQGLLATHWCLNARLTQTAYKDWLKIPVISNGFFPGLDSASRDQLIEEAFQQVDAHSWRWECWRGWTAWKWQA